MSQIVEIPDHLGSHVRCTKCDIYLLRSNRASVSIDPNGKAVASIYFGQHDCGQWNSNPAPWISQTTIKRLLKEQNV